MARSRAARSFRENLARSAGPDAAALSDEIGRFTAWILSLRRGDRITATYLPSDGIVVSTSARADEYLGSAAFARALFGAWIGPRPVSTAFRESLLSGDSR